MLEWSRPNQYQRLVSQQLEHYAQEYGINEPLTAFVSNLAKNDNKPLWWLSFAEKHIRSEASNSYSFTISDETQLVELGIPRQYDLVIIEREIVISRKGNESLVERIYYTRKSHGERRFEIISVLEPRNYSAEETFYLLSTQEVHDGQQKIVTSFSTKQDIRTLLQAPRPIASFPSATRCDLQSNGIAQLKWVRLF